MTLQLHDYQRFAVAFLRSQDHSGLGLDVGLGKTACSLAALEPRHLPVLVVAPKEVAKNTWHTERVKWRPDLSIARAIGDPAERLAVLQGDQDITVLSRDNVGDLAKLRAQRRHPKYATVIIDELSGYKGRGARYKQMRDLVRRPHIRHVWGLTATPAPNGYLDLWPQIDLISNGDNPLGPNITTFKGRYFKPERQLANGTIVSWDLRPESEGHIKRLIEPIFLAMSGEGRIKLPPVTQNDLVIRLPPAARRAYREMEAEMVTDLVELLGPVHTAANAAVVTSKLSQITAGFLFEDERLEPSAEDPDVLEHVNAGVFTHLHDESVNAVKALVGAQGSPVLVFYRYRPQRDQLLAALPGARLITERDVVEDWDAGRVPALIAHPEQAKYGLNLQYGGHTVVWASPTWSLEDKIQGDGRLARQGQQHPVVVHTVIAEDTLDGKIRVRVETKDAVQVDLLEYLGAEI